MGDKAPHGAFNETLSARNGYKVWEVTFSHGKKKDACGANHSGSKPHFSHQIKGKNWSFEELLWDTENLIR